ncbi:MAG: transcriptional repressor LexA [Clostridia bacterium]|nr:transcriptional repressor LexA [Clostridiales bacterium]MBQ2977355.1 transcriptional repressor LexA [Clostridia bacterium]MBQ6804597.1 transcriptional repressor LexA [Clostridia bacterium]
MPRRPHGDTQQRILDYIENYIEVNGYPPSVREIGQAVDLKSTSTVHGHLNRLEKKGLLHREAMKPRTIDVTRNDKPQMVKLPILGKVAAGVPILAEENADGYEMLPDSIVGNGDHYILEIRGESMITAGIMNGDFVVVKRQPTAQNGDIIIAMIDDEATCKRYFKEPDRIRLQPENPRMHPMYVRSVEILGKVVAVYRKYGK